MTVQELIDELMKVKDKSTPVFYVHDISDYQLHREIIEKPYYVYDKETAEKIARETTANVIRIQKIEWEE